MWRLLFIAPWIVILLWWIVRAAGAARVVEREPAMSRLSYNLILALAAVLLANKVQVEFLLERLWGRSLVVASAGLALEWSGIAFAIWAREALGHMWSGSVTLKQEHQIVRTGPYALTRHPIYTGILTAGLGVALVHANLSALLALVLMILGLLRKIAIEERLLERHFGEDYRLYRQQVRALIPFVL
jgi:protein-S-isoprenylcysteine O-methyltransferase Ste14